MRSLCVSAGTSNGAMGGGRAVLCHNGVEQRGNGCRTGFGLKQHQDIACAYTGRGFVYPMLSDEPQFEVRFEGWRAIQPTNLIARPTLYRRVKCLNHRCGTFQEGRAEPCLRFRFTLRWFWGGSAGC
jgi:hypothetical protein